MVFCSRRVLCISLGVWFGLSCFLGVREDDTIVIDLLGSLGIHARHIHEQIILVTLVSAIFQIPIRVTLNQGDFVMDWGLAVSGDAIARVRTSDPASSPLDTRTYIARLVNVDTGSSRTILGPALVMFQVNVEFSRCAIFAHNVLSLHHVVVDHKDDVALIRRQHIILKVSIDVHDIHPVQLFLSPRQHQGRKELEMFLVPSPHIG
mmetsp:Transcript_12782/g.29747  ORF Transcript_12782/g.29747 Transcript_12782/m.29747 type:complete len:206 (+) Transcript_12782:2789-3406(+)